MSSKRESTSIENIPPSRSANFDNSHPFVLSVGILRSRDYRGGTDGRRPGVPNVV